MNQNPLIGIVTVLYNSETVLEEFFETLNQQTYTHFVLYVVDNASPDNSLALAKNLASKVSFKTVFFAEKKNWGVAKGNNIGIISAIKDGCKYVLLANNDIVLEPFSISNLMKASERRDALLAVPKIYYHGTHLIWAAGGRFDRFRICTHHSGNKEEDHGQFEQFRPVEYSPTCFMLVHKSVFEEVGLMDEKYFVYYDDTDFCWRATQNFHKQIWYVPTSKIWHKESTCTGHQSDFSIYYLHRNAIYFLKKTFPFYKQLLPFAYIFLHSVLRKPFLLNAKQRKLVRIAYKDGYKLRQCTN